MKTKEETQRYNERIKEESTRLLEEAEERIKVRSEQHRYFSNLWGETDIPETKWFTVAKRQVLNNKENTPFRQEVDEVIEDTLMGWTDSITELKSSVDTILYTMKRIEESKDQTINRDDYLLFLAHRTIAIALLSRLSIAKPELLDSLREEKLKEIQSGATSTETKPAEEPVKDEPIVTKRPEGPTQEEIQKALSVEIKDSGVFLEDLFGVERQRKESGDK